MSEYLIKGETLNAIGDEVRTLAGTQNAMSPGAMATNIGTANSEISSQSDLITQIASVLSGKAAGGSGGGNTDVEDGIIMGTITEINNDRVTLISNYAFYSCSKLTSVSFSKATSIGSYAFYSCKSLASVNFPKVTSIGGSAFYYCTSLASVSFPVATSIGSYAFASCSKLTQLYLANLSVATLANANAFTNTPMSKSTYTGSFGSIYVPASLVTAYRSATNWVTYSSRITQIMVGGDDAPLEE